MPINVQRILARSLLCGRAFTNRSKAPLENKFKIGAIGLESVIRSPTLQVVPWLFGSPSLPRSRPRAFTQTLG
jgi:hypothetical protein